MIKPWWSPLKSRFFMVKTTIFHGFNMFKQPFFMLKSTIFGFHNRLVVGSPGVTSRPMAIGSGSAGNGAGTWGVGSAACTGDQGGMDLSRGFTPWSFLKWIFRWFLSEFSSCSTCSCMSNGLVNVISSGFKLVLSRSSMGKKKYVWTGEERRQ